MQVYEMKKGHEGIFMGTLDDMRNLFRNFIHGNYTVSRPNFYDGLPVLVFHHENVDPHKIVDHLKSASEDELEPPSSKKDKQGNSNVISPQKWCGQQAGGHYDQDYDYLKEIGEAHAKLGIRTELTYSQLLYFVKDVFWSLEKKGITVEASLVGRTVVYHLMHTSEPTIGFIVNPHGILRDDVKNRAILFQDPLKDALLVRYYYAVAIYPDINVFPDQESKNGENNFVLSMEEFLYDTSFRCFQKGDICQENPFYGDALSDDFSSLPRELMLAILKYLPWRQRIVCRRVSKQWRAIGNSALARETLDDGAPEFHRLTTSEMGWLIPLMANRLTRLILSKDQGGKFDLEPLIPHMNYRSLHEIDFGWNILSYHQLAKVIAKCPNLQRLTAVIPAVPHGTVDWIFSRLGNLHLCLAGDVTAFHLECITRSFPNLRQLSIPDCQSLSSDKLCFLLDHYGEQLARLKVQRRKPTAGNLLGDVDISNGISACSNLTTLSLSRTPFITDNLMGTISERLKYLVSLDLEGASTLTAMGLSKLAMLEHLKRLNINGIGRGLDEGLVAVTLKGRLEQLLSRDTPLSPTCLAFCIGDCIDLKVIDIRGHDNLRVEQALDIIQMYAQFGHSRYLIIRSTLLIWQDSRVHASQENLLRDHHRSLIIDSRHHVDGFLESDSDLPINSGHQFVIDEERMEKSDENMEDNERTACGEGEETDGDDEYKYGEMSPDDPGFDEECMYA